MKLKPSAVFCMVYVMYIALFLMLSCILSYHSAMKSSILMQGGSPYPIMGTILIDPGHGGQDGGAVGISGTNEKDLNLSVSKKLQMVLNLFGIAADMTREEDIMLGDGGETIGQKKVEDMHTRLNMVNASSYRAFLSVHMNSYPEEKYWGSQVFYAKSFEESRKIGESMQIALRTFVAPDNKREAKPASDEIYLLKHAACPALIIECGFITNRLEEKLLKTQEHQTKLAAAVAVGYLQSQFDMYI